MTVCTHDSLAGGGSFWSCKICSQKKIAFSKGGVA